MKKDYAIIFDLDGTLIHSTATIMFNANMVLARYDAEPVTLAKINSFVGNGPLVLMQKILAYHQSIGQKIKVTAEVLTVEFNQQYDDNFYQDTVVYEGVIDALDALKSAKIPMAICTNKQISPTIKLLEYYKLNQYFEFVIGGDQVPKRKPDPAGVHKCIDALSAKKYMFIGDSEIDAQTAINAKIDFYLYEGGYLNAPLSEISYIEKFSHFNQLKTIIESAY